MNHFNFKDSMLSKKKSSVLSKPKKAINKKKETDLSIKDVEHNTFCCPSCVPRTTERRHQLHECARQASQLRARQWNGAGASLKQTYWSWAAHLASVQTRAPLCTHNLLRENCRIEKCFYHSLIKTYRWQFIIYIHMDIKSIPWVLYNETQM